MAKFKKTKVNPLTAMDSLNLQKASEKHFDATNLDVEKKDEMMAKLMDIIRKTEGAIVFKRVGGKQYASAVVRTTKQKGTTFVFPEPNLIQTYYRVAVQHLEAAEQKQQLFHEAHNGHPEQEFNTFSNFLEEITRGVVFLLMTIEGFINQLPIDGQNYPIAGSNRTKQDIEWMNVTDKLRLALPAVTGIDIYATNRPMYDRLHLLNDLRNDLIHLKKFELPNFTHYQELFKRLLDFPAAEMANTVFDFINTIQPGFLVEENDN